MIKIYHNPRCRKSREGLAILENSGKEFEIVRYLENVPDKEEMAAILEALQLSPEAIIRKNEAIWKEKFKGRDLSEEELIDAMISNPKLIERPIVVKDGLGVVGRPPENIKQLLD